MKFTIVALCVLSAVLSVSTASTGSLVRREVVDKEVVIGCNGNDQAKTCKHSITEILSESLYAEDKFTDVFVQPDYDSSVEAVFTGSCPTANEVIRALQGCSIQECPTISCAVP